MVSPSDSDSLTATRAFRQKLEELTERLADLRPSLQDDDLGAILTQDLETAYEELQVADEEVRSQQEQITSLLQDQNRLRLKHERMLAVLPIAVLTTDPHGMILNANAAAASLLEVQPSRAVGKPVFTFTAPEDRPALRRELSTQARFGRDFRHAVTLRTRNGRLVAVQLAVNVVPGGGDERSWMLLSPTLSSGRTRALSDPLPQALVQLASLPSERHGLHALVEGAAAICQEALGAGTTVSLNVGDPLSPDAVSTTSKTAQGLDGAQLAARSGPCVSAYDERALVVSSDLRSDHRWPGLEIAALHEVTGAVSVPLEASNELLGVLNVYVRQASVEDKLEDCELLANTIAAVLMDVRLHDELAVAAANMEKALESRATIDQAKGIVMADRHCSPEQAFEYLVAMSSKRHVKLRDIAQAIVDQTSQRS
jgi:PAS domain S-box-containing protein